MRKNNFFFYYFFIKISRLFKNRKKYFSNEKLWTCILPN